MSDSSNTKLKLMAIFSVIFSLVGFSYNAWRMEVSEDNNNRREAAFEVLKELGDLEQTVYALHYDHNVEEGSPRKGWVIVGLVEDLSPLVSANVGEEAVMLRKVWSKHWETLEEEQASTDAVIQQVEVLQEAIKQNLLDID